MEHNPYEMVASVATAPLTVLTLQAPQTPQQRRANERFANKEASKMGTYRVPKEDKETRDKMRLNKRYKGKPASTWVVSKCTIGHLCQRGLTMACTVGLLAVLVGGGALELIRFFF